jgi:A nuclease of the HNH/ENDO VII superfamily with conserved WHH
MTDNTTKGRIYTMTSPPPNEEAAAEQQDSVPATGKNPLEQAKNEAADVLQKKWDDLQKGLSTLKDATGLGVSPEIASAARQRMMEGAKDIAKDAIFRVGGGGSPQERAAKAQEQVDAQIDQMRQAYSRNGLAGMVGAMATNMAMEKVAGKVIGATKAGAGKIGDAPHDSKPPTTTTQNTAPPKNNGVVVKKPKGGAWDYAPNIEEWEKKGGAVTKNTDGSVTYTRKDGVSVVYDKDGYPDFSPHAKNTVVITDMKGDHYYDFKAANKEIGISGPKPPESYTWHHSQDGRTMQLVPKSIHNVADGGFAHAGGVSMLKK